jgi:DNA-3-methyladenine glycosylase II
MVFLNLFLKKSGVSLFVVTTACVLEPANVYLDSMDFTSAELFLIEKDPKLGAVIQAHGHLDMRPERAEFESLVRSIIGQQISVKAASSIYQRLVTATKLEPNVIASLNEAQIKEIGLSQSKARYLTDLAEHFVRDASVFNHLAELVDADVITELTRIKGIGIWTAQMFLMFTLRRPDVFAPDDHGLQNAVERIYEYSEKLKRAELEQIAENWSPYRTTASLHLWHSLKNEPV